MADCPKHGTPRTQRYRDGAKAGWMCRECDREYNRRHVAKDRGAKAAYMRKWHMENRARCNEYQNEWRRRRREAQDAG